MFKIKSSIEFDAAHFLTETNTQCDMLHGHRWKVEVTLKSKELNNNGFVINFSVLKKILKECTDGYDHNLLNYYIEQPTAEILAYCIWIRIHKKLWKYNKDNNMDVKIEQVEINETPNNSAIFTLNDINVKKESSRFAAFKMWRNEKQRANITNGLRKAGKNPTLRKFHSDRMKENNPMNDRNAVEKMLKSLKKSNKQCPNKEEKKIIDFFKENNIPVIFVGNGDFVLGGKIPDFVDYEKKIIIEYNGRFWHSNNNEWYNVKDDSKDRINFFKKFGYRTFIIWSDEFKENPEKILKEIRKLYEL